MIHHNYITAFIWKWYKTTTTETGEIITRIITCFVVFLKRRWQLATQSGVIYSCINASHATIRQFYSYIVADMDNCKTYEDIFLETLQIYSWDWGLSDFIGYFWQDI